MQSRLIHYCISHRTEQMRKRLEQSYSVKRSSGIARKIAGSSIAI
jgi:hypothetical protein